uniref:Uncharacterized protein n=1 Tax=Populus trichocarpa TaxID=3694 RepID=A0A2K1X5U7_POPTR
MGPDFCHWPVNVGHQDLSFPLCIKKDKVETEAGNFLRRVGKERETALLEASGMGEAGMTLKELRRVFPSPPIPQISSSSSLYLSSLFQQLWITKIYHPVRFYCDLKGYEQSILCRSSPVSSRQQ